MVSTGSSLCSGVVFNVFSRGIFSKLAGIWLVSWVDTHWCVKDLIVANRGAQIPADVETQVSVTWPFASLNCRATKDKHLLKGTGIKRLLVEQHVHWPYSTCLLDLLLKRLHTFKWIQPESLIHVWQHWKVIQPVHAINFNVFPRSCQGEYGRISSVFLHATLWKHDSLSIINLNYTSGCEHMHNVDLVRVLDLDFFKPGLCSLKSLIFLVFVTSFSTFYTCWNNHKCCLVLHLQPHIKNER